MLKFNWQNYIQDSSSSSREERRRPPRSHNWGVNNILFYFLNGVVGVQVFLIFSLRSFYMKHCKIIQRMLSYSYLLIKMACRSMLPETLPEIFLQLVSKMLPHYTDYSANVAPMHNHFIIPFHLLFKLITVTTRRETPLHTYIFQLRANSLASSLCCTWEVFYMVYFIKYCTGWARLGVVCLHLNKKVLLKGLQKTLILLIYWDYILFRQLLQKIVSHFSSNIPQILISNKHFRVKSSFLNTT